MEGQLFTQLYDVLVTLGKHQLGKKGQSYAPLVIVAVYLWSVLHDRPAGWACHRANWQNLCPWPKLPSESTLSRRLKTIPVQQLQEQLLAHFNDQLPSGLLKRLDSRSLPVSWVSKDPEAKTGYGAGQLIHGYKLHELKSHASGHLESWSLTPMNTHDSLAAMALIPHVQGYGYIGADNAYDVNRLYDLAGQYDHQLIAPPKRRARNMGHRRHSPYRLRAGRLLEYSMTGSGEWYSWGRQMLQARKLQETAFAHEVTNPCGSLGPLPFYVRRPHRVARYVITKLTIDRLYQIQRFARL